MEIMSEKKLISFENNEDQTIYLFNFYNKKKINNFQTLFIILFFLNSQILLNGLISLPNLLLGNFFIFQYFLIIK